jgi:hypothetical protein
MKHSLKKFGLADKKLRGSTSDSGASTPESWSKGLEKEGLWEDVSMEDSCGIHDLQSGFRLATQHFVGEGNLKKRNAIQLLHTMYSLYDELNGWETIESQAKNWDAAERRLRIVEKAKVRSFTSDCLRAAPRRKLYDS